MRQRDGNVAESLLQLVGLLLGCDLLSVFALLPCHVLSCLDPNSIWLLIQTIQWYQIHILSYVGSAIQPQIMKKPES